MVTFSCCFRKTFEKTCHITHPLYCKNPLIHSSIIAIVTAFCKDSTERVKFLLFLPYVRVKSSTLIREVKNDVYGKREILYDHVTMFILYLPLAVFSFSVKSSSFTLASKARISLHYSHQENINANLTFAVCGKRDSY